MHQFPLRFAFLRLRISLAIILYIASFDCHITAIHPHVNQIMTHLRCSPFLIRLILEMSSTGILNNRLLMINTTTPLSIYAWFGLFVSFSEKYNPEPAIFDDLSCRDISVLLVNSFTVGDSSLGKFDASQTSKSSSFKILFSRSTAFVNDTWFKNPPKSVRLSRLTKLSYILPQKGL